MDIDIIIPSCKALNDVASMIEEIELNRQSQGQIIFTGLKASASCNRNDGISKAKTDICIMLDDDMTGFFPGWDVALIKPLLDDPNVSFTCSRLLKPNKQLAHMMSGNYNDKADYVEVNKFPTACFAFWRRHMEEIKNDENTIGKPFDENFVGSGWEDDDICFEYKVRWPQSKFIINNKCKLIHINEMKNQWTNGFFEKNKQYYMKKRGRIL